MSSACRPCQHKNRPELRSTSGVFAQSKGGLPQPHDSLRLHIWCRRWHRAQLQAQPVEGWCRGLQMTPCQVRSDNLHGQQRGVLKCTVPAYALSKPCTLPACQAVPYRPERVCWTSPDNSAGTRASAPATSPKEGSLLQRGLGLTHLPVGRLHHSSPQQRPHL